MYINYILLLLITVVQSLKIINCKPGGLYGFYMLGVSKYMKEHYSFKDSVFYGASAGAWNSLYLTLKKDDKKFLDYIENIEVSHIKNMFSIEEILKKFIIDNYKYSDFEIDKINICVGILNNYKIQKKIFTSFDSLEDVLDCCIASSHIPYITNNKPFFLYKNDSCIDGGFFGDPLPENVSSDLVLSPEIWNATHINHFSKIKTLDIKRLIKEGYQDSYRNRNQLSKRLL